MRARLDFYRNCRGDIANMDGRLVCRESEGDITLYEHSNFRGRSLQVSGDMPAVPRWFNDMASSIQVRRGAWQVCEDVSYRGRCETVRSNVENLNRMGLNDRISSVVVRHGSWEVCSDARFQGQCVVLRPGRYPTLAAAGIDNAISSIREVKRHAGADRDRYAADKRDNRFRDDNRYEYRNDGWRFDRFENRWERY